MKIKKMFYKIGILPIILILSIGLIGVVPVMADDPVEPQAGWAQGVDGSPVINDGTDVISFSWECYNWVGTPVHYTFAIWQQSPLTRLGIQYSDTAGTDDLVNPPTSLQNIAAFSEGQSIYNPDNLGGGTPNPGVNSHDWVVPEGLVEGQYYGALEVYSTKEGIGTTLEASTQLSFYVQQAEGDLTVYKEDYEATPLDGWDFTVYEAGTLNIVDTGQTGDGGNPTGYYTFEDLDIGLYDVKENIKTDWVCVDIYDVSTATSDGSPSDGVMEGVEVTFEGDTLVEFTNQQNVGNLVIHKHTDSVIDNDPADLVDWHFSVSPGGYSGDTLSNGTLTFSGIPVDTYTVTETLRGGWRSTDPGGDPPTKSSISVTVGDTTNVDFYNQELGALEIFKFEDLDTIGSFEGEVGWAGWGFKVSGPSGTTTVGPTNSSGVILVEGLIPGTYTVEEVSSPPGVYYQCTYIDPASTYTKKTDVTVYPGGIAFTDFGNIEIIRQVPTMGQWGIIALSTIFVALLVWFGVRRRRIA